MVRKDKATETFIKGCTCSQAVTAVFADQYGLDLDTILRISRGFGGGMGGTGSVCGAVTGAYMVLGMAYDPADQASKAILYREIQEFNRRFHERHRHINCRDLLGLDLSSEADKVLIKERKLFDTHCSVYVREAVEIVEEILACRLLVPN